MADDLKTLLHDVQSRDARISRPSLPREGKRAVPSRLTGGECLGILAHLEPEVARRDIDVLVKANVTMLRRLVKEHCGNFAERLRSRESSPTRVLDYDSDGEERAVSDEEPDAEEEAVVEEEVAAPVEEEAAGELPDLLVVEEEAPAVEETSDEGYLKKTFAKASPLDSASSDGTTTIDVAVVNGDMSARDDSLKGRKFHEVVCPFVMQDKGGLSSPNPISLGVFSEMQSLSFANELVESLNSVSAHTRYNHISNRLSYDCITTIYDADIWELADVNVEVSSQFKYQAVLLRHLHSGNVIKSYAVHLPHKKGPRPSICLAHILDKIENQEEEVDANIISGDMNTTPEKIRGVLSEFNGHDLAIPDKNHFTTTKHTSKDNLIIDDGVLSFKPGLIQDRGIRLHHIPMIKGLSFAEN